MPETRDIAVLCDALGEGRTPAEVGLWLDEALASGRVTWPGVDLGVDEYVAHLVEHARKGAGLASLHAADLYLAAACTAGSRPAIAAFEAAYSTDLAAVIRRVSGSVDVEEVMQNLRESLFVGKGGAPSKVRDYSGSGPLRAWLRVMSTRAALNAVTRGPKERLARGDDELIADAAGGVESAEVAYFRVHYEAEVKTAFPQALAALSQRERLLLRQHYVDRLALDEMAGVHAVHVATIKRQLASAREALTGHLRALLLQRLRLSPSELQSVLVLVQSRLHVTMRRLLPDRSSASAVLEPLPDSGSLSEE